MPNAKLIVYAGLQGTGNTVSYFVENVLLRCSSWKKIGNDFVAKSKLITLYVLYECFFWLNPN